MSIWRDKSTTEAMAKEGYRDCKGYCAGCGLPWRHHPTDTVHMIEDTENKTPCDSPHSFYAGTCWDNKNQ